jgi:hypothetical protein
MKNECLQFDLSGLKIRFMDGTEIPADTGIWVNGKRVDYKDLWCGKWLSVIDDKDNFNIKLEMEGK